MSKNWARWSADDGIGYLRLTGLTPAGKRGAYSDIAKDILFGTEQATAPPPPPPPPPPTLEPARRGLGYGGVARRSKRLIGKGGLRRTA